MIPKLRLMPFRGRWWIVGDRDAGPMGRYDTKAEAESDRRGVLRTYKDLQKPETKEN